MNYGCLAITILCGIACQTPSLAKEVVDAELVRKVRLIIGDPPANCIEVADVEASGAYHSKAKAHLREVAVEKNANLVRMEFFEAGNGSWYVAGTAFRCEQPNPGR